VKIIFSPKPGTADECIVGLRLKAETKRDRTALSDLLIALNGWNKAGRERASLAAYLADVEDRRVYEARERSRAADEARGR
jgi:hypothetical protein